MRAVADFTQPDWEWLRRVLGAERADDPEYPDRVEAAIALRDAGMPEDAVRGWTDAVDANPNRYNVFMDGVVDRILDLHQRHVAPADGAQWLWTTAPTGWVRALLRVERTPDTYRAFLKAASTYRHALPEVADGPAAGAFLTTWMFGTTFPVNEATAYALAGITPQEALDTWEPIRQVDPERWATTLGFMVAMVTDPENRCAD